MEKYFKVQLLTLKDCGNYDRNNETRTGVLLHFQRLCFIYINVIVAHCHTFWTVTMEL